MPCNRLRLRALYPNSAGRGRPEVGPAGRDVGVRGIYDWQTHGIGLPYRAIMGADRG
jgi:hypothetical protein